MKINKIKGTNLDPDHENQIKKKRRIPKKKNTKKNQTNKQTKKKGKQGLTSHQERPNRNFQHFSTGIIFLIPVKKIKK